MNTNIQAIIGLGNPGQNYALTRHNAGFWLIDLIAQKYGCTWKLDSKNQASVSDLQLGIKKIRLFKPTTYMNCSGSSVSLLTKYYKIPTEDVLIVHDDVDIEPGNIRFKFDGGHGGHNGLRDIMQSLNSKSFYRLRIGVGRPANTSGVQNYVLQQPTKLQQNMIIEKLQEIIAFVPDFIEGDYQNIMNKLHKKNQLNTINLKEF
ncbi:MAG: aminoacyl-tRNA hydrolase [Legionellales bacterium]|nr:aminoacyl-tRNA hydrolase [Legionellales bacterium]